MKEVNNMDYLTELISSEIKKQYRSVRSFALSINVPQTTIVSALQKGVSGTAYVTVLKMCEALNIKVINYETHVKLDDKGLELLNKYNRLDEKGEHTVSTVLEMEYRRCMDEEDAKK